VTTTQTPARPATTLPAPSEFARHWTLDPGTVYLNHGSFGACPRAVLEAQGAYRAEMEREAVRFFVERLQGLMDQTRTALGGFLRCRPQDLALLPNATTAVATVLRNIEPTLRPGDELLGGTHEYPACMNSLRQTAKATGAVVTTAELPFPVRSAEQVVDAIMARVTPRTRLVLVSHITSSSGYVVPIERFVPELEKRGIRCLVDGAHAAGSLAGLDVAGLGASYYTANCHKWLCTPKGSAFLHVREDLQQGFRPLALSNFAERPKPGRAQFLTEFDYIGTADPTAYLAIPEALRTMGAMVPGGWPEVMQRNHALLLRGRDIVCRALGVEPPVPDSMLACISTIPLPPHPPELASRLAARPSRYHDALQDILVDRHKVQVPLWSTTPAGGQPVRVLRISAQLYNSVAQYEYLARVLVDEVEAERGM
jgi:isopenicillin-N epimerase